MKRSLVLLLRDLRRRVLPVCPKAAPAGGVLLPGTMCVQRESGTRVAGSVERGAGSRGARLGLTGSCGVRGKARRRTFRGVDSAAWAGACLLPAQPVLMILSHVRALALGDRWPCRSQCTCCSPVPTAILLVQAPTERLAQRPAVVAKLLTPGVCLVFTEPHLIHTQGESKFVQ